MGTETVHSELQTLVQLQELDLRANQINQRIKQIPEELKQLDEFQEASKRILDRSATALEESRKERKRLENDVEVLRQRLSKYKGQLMSVKTNKEYQAMLHEIEMTEQAISQAEDRILERMIADDDLDKQAREAENELARKQQELDLKRKELDDFVASTANELQRLEKERQELEAALPAELLAMYHRIATARNGLALAPVRDHSCQACHVMLRPQLLNDVKANQRIIRCESCNRILYYGDTVKPEKLS